MRYILLILLAATYLLADCTGLLPEQGVPFLFRALGYSFFHANIFHLLVNGLAIWTLFSPKHKDNIRCLLLGYVISIIVYPLSFRPMVGISNLLYATIGLRTPSFKNPWWKNPSVIVFFSITILMAVLPQVAATTHIASFLLGTAIACLTRYINSLDNDIRKANR